MSRHEIQILRAAHMTQATVAIKTGVSEQSVRRIEREPPVTTSDAATLTKARGIGRPSQATPWTRQLETWVTEDPTLPGVELLRRAREAGYGGGKSALYDLVRRLRRPTPAPLVRFEGVPGEFSQHDFGEVDVRYLSGAVERVHFFASRLKWSRVADVHLVTDEREESLIRALLAAFETFGGVPLVIV